MINRKIFDPKHLRFLILEEADQLLSRSHGSQSEVIADILRSSTFPVDIQLVLVGSTINSETIQLLEQYRNSRHNNGMIINRELVKLTLPRNDLVRDRIEYYYVDVEKEEWKLETLKDIYQTCTITQTIIFCNTSR